MFFSKWGRCTRNPPRSGFQSLFSWMFFSKIGVSRRIFPSILVSILVLLDVFLEASYTGCDLPCHSVSILVLLDVFLEASYTGCDLPCHSVSILVLLDVFLEVGNSDLVSHPSRVSILVLLDVFLEDCMSIKRILVIRSFNPCSLGCFSRSRLIMGQTDLCLVFQSLFSWMFFSKNDLRDLKNHPSSFNPCSLGCFSRRINM